MSLQSVSPLTTDGLRFSHQLDVGVGKERITTGVLLAPAPPQPPNLDRWSGTGMGRVGPSPRVGLAPALSF